MSFKYGPYEITNVKNGGIATQGEFPHAMPVVASPENSIWTIAPPQTRSEPSDINEITILKKGQPVNVYKDLGDLGNQDDHVSGIVAIQLSENTNVWRLHEVKQDVYLIFFSKQGWSAADMDSKRSHWRLPSSLKGSKVLVETDEDHPVNELLKPYLLEELAVEEFTIKLNELTDQVPESFWKFKQIVSAETQ